MIAAGVGFRWGCTPQEILAVLSDAEARAGVTADVIAAPSFKVDEAGLTGLSLMLIDDAAMEAVRSACVTLMPAPRAPAEYY